MLADHTGMEHEARISYLCTQAARDRLSLDEETELLSYIALDLELLELIWIEALLRDWVNFYDEDQPG